jgi:hypothetical protein
MTTDSNLTGIREKIYKLRTAIMYSMSNEVCKLPNSIVTVLQVDDAGQLWFICKRPFQKVGEYEHSFPVRLHFYRKGVFFHLEVSGKATIVDKAQSDYLPYEVSAEGQVILIRMAMNTIEHTEPFGKKERSRLELLVEKGYKWMLRSITLPYPSKPEHSKWQSN